MNPLVLNLTSDPKDVPVARRAIEAACDEAGFDRTTAEQIGLTVNEALANVIRHAYHDAPGRPIELTAAMNGGELRITLRDWGNGRVPDSTDPPPEELCTPGGLGLTCIRRIMDRVDFAPQPDGMLLTMTKVKT